MENLLPKYNLLDQFSQKLVDDFIELLIKRQHPVKVSSLPKPSKAKKQSAPGQASPDNQAEPGNTAFDYKAYKKQLLALRPWTKEEVKEFDENLSAFRKMTMTEW